MPACSGAGLNSLFSHLFVIMTLYFLIRMSAKNLNLQNLHCYGYDFTLA